MWTPLTFDVDSGPEQDADGQVGGIGGGAGASFRNGFNSGFEQTTCADATIPTTVDKRDVALVKVKMVLIYGLRSPLYVQQKGGVGDKHGSLITAEFARLSLNIDRHTFSNFRPFVEVLSSNSFSSYRHSSSLLNLLSPALATLLFSDITAHFLFLFLLQRYRY